MTRRRRRIAAALALGLVLAPTGAALAAEPAIPGAFDPAERFIKPDLSGLTRLRFLTTLDFPPFSFLDAQGKLTGFHVDLARAICQELGILDRCEIQALPWAELKEAVAKGQGEAIIAGMAVSAENRAGFAFSRPYLQFPARFVVPKASDLQEPMSRSVAGKRIGVVAGSAHAQLLKDYFAGATPVDYPSEDALLADLKAGKVDGVFGDGMRLSIWLANAASEACCRFAGGPYIAPDYFGAGLAIAVPAERQPLATAFDFALREMQVNGRFAELYLRYFPVGFY